jgi:beta-phosphoglucomutase
LRLLHLGEEFDAIVDGNMILHTKPHPEIFLKAAEKLGVAARDCLVVEDAEAGVEAALAAGMKCIGIGSPETLHRANIVFPRTSDITLSTLAELAYASD